MTYKHLTIEERCSIAYYLEERFSVKEIAVLIHRDPSTVRREIKRNSEEGEYIGSLAHHKATGRYKSMKNASKFTEPLRLKLLEKLKLDWSPEQIRGHFLRSEEHFLSFSTIYHWIRKGLFGNITEHLRRTGKPYKRKADVNIMKGGTSIHERPKEIEERLEPGHWELDTVVGPLGTKSAIVTAVDRKTRLLLSRKVENRRSETVALAIIELLSSYSVQSLTFDNGKEFSKHRELGLIFNCPTYFADPRSPWQRGTNENTNGLIRQYFPKGTYFEYLNDDDIDQVVHSINTRPRKVLGYSSAHDFYFTSNA